MAISQGQWPSVERMVKSEFEGCEFEDQLAPTFTRAKRKQNKSPESTGSLLTVLRLALVLRVALIGNNHGTFLQRLLTPYNPL